MFLKNTFYSIVIFTGLFLTACALNGAQPPYKPPFSVRHPVIANALAAGAVGLGTYALASTGGAIALNPAYTGALSSVGLNPATLASLGNAALQNASIFGTISSVCTYMYRIARHKLSLLDALLTDPAKALQEKAAIAHNVENALMNKQLEKYADQKKAFQEFQQCVAEFEKQSPIFALHECNDSRCPLTRDRICPFRFTDCRKTLTSNVSTALVDALNAKTKEPVHYAGFACAGAFEDLVHAVNTLAQKPDASLVFNFIDTKNALNVACRDAVKRTREINPGDTFTLSDVNDSALKQLLEVRKKENAKEMLAIREKLANAPSEGALLELAFMLQKRSACEKHEELLLQDHKANFNANELQYRQFISTLRKLFPHAQLTLLIHDSAQSYLEYIEHNRLPYPDVISASDFEFTEFDVTHCAKDYITLVAKILQRKPTLKNFWLAKKLDNSVCLISFSLVPTAGSIQDDFEIAPGRSIQVYSRRTNL